MERCFPAHDEGSKDRWGVELAPGLVLRNIIIIIRYPTEFNKNLQEGSSSLSRIMDTGTEMGACCQRWHPYSWQLTSKSNFIPELNEDSKILLLLIGVL